MDHIRDWYFYKDTILTESEWNLVLLFQRLDRWDDHSVYFNKKGELIEEILMTMIHIDNYKIQSSQGRGGSTPQKQWFDL